MTKYASLDVSLDEAAAHDPRLGLLASVPGVGPLTAAGFIAAIGEATRFAGGQPYRPRHA